MLKRDFKIIVTIAIIFIVIIALALICIRLQSRDEPQSVETTDNFEEPLLSNSTEVDSTEFIDSVEQSLQEDNVDYTNESYFSSLSDDELLSKLETIDAFCNFLHDKEVYNQYGYELVKRETTDKELKLLFRWKKSDAYFQLRMSSDNEWQFSTVSNGYGSEYPVVFFPEADDEIPAYATDLYTALRDDGFTDIYTATYSEAYNSIYVYTIQNASCFKVYDWRDDVDEFGDE